MIRRGKPPNTRKTKPHKPRPESQGLEITGGAHMDEKNEK